MYGNIQLWIDPAKVGCPFDKDEVLRRRTTYIERRHPETEQAAYEKAVAALDEVFNSCAPIKETLLRQEVDEADTKDGRVVLTSDGLFHVQVKLGIDVCRRKLAEPVNLLERYASRAVVYCWINVDPTKEAILPCGCWMGIGKISGLMITRSPKEFEPHRLRIEMHMRNTVVGISVSRNFFDFLSQKSRADLFTQDPIGDWGI